MAAPADLVLLLRGAAGGHPAAPEAPEPLTEAALPGLRRLARQGRWHPFEAAPSGFSPHAGGDLLAAFGVGVPGGEDPPIGALDWLGAHGEAGAPAYMRADPVHLAVTPRGVFPTATGLALTRAEAQALVTSLQAALWGEEGMTLAALSPEAWALALPSAPRLRTVPPGIAAGREAGDALPTGADAAAWHRRLNEAQMLLADHPVNRERRADGWPEVNGLALWGVGPLPLPSGTPWGAVAGSSPLLAGLAALEGLPEPEPAVDGSALLAGLPAGGPVLAVADAPLGAGGPAERAAALEALDEDWLAPVAEALSERRLRRAWVVLGPADTAEPPPTCPALDCRAGRPWPWRRGRLPDPRRLRGPLRGWADTA